MFTIWCIDCVRVPLCELNLLCIFVLRITSGLRVKICRQSALTIVYGTNRSKAMVLELFLFCIFLFLWLCGFNYWAFLVATYLALCSHVFYQSYLAWRRGSLSICFSCIYLLILHALISVPFRFLFIWFYMAWIFTNNIKKHILHKYQFISFISLDRACFRNAYNHPAGDVTRVSVVPRKVTVKIGDAENWWRGCRDKNRLKVANIPIRLFLSRVPFRSGVWN